MVAHDEVVCFSHEFRPVVLMATEIGWHVFVWEEDLVDIDSTVLNTNRVAFSGDDPFHEGLVRVPGVVEHHDVTWLG